MPLTANARKMTAFAMFLAVSIVIQAVEFIYLPSLPLPGVKIGLANIVTLLMLTYFTLPETAIAVVIRVFAASLVTGTFATPVFYFSLGGAAVSLAAISFLYYVFYGKLSLTGIGSAGAIAHNLGQLAVAFLFIGKVSLVLYAPVLMLAALPFGILTGLAANIAKSRLSESLVLG